MSNPSVSYAMPSLSLEDACLRLRTPAPVFNALLSSGLLGYTEDGRVPVAGIEQFEQYGTQWRAELGERHWGPDPYQDMPVPPGIEGGEQPPDTGTHVQVAAAPNELADADTGWLAQFYIRPNRFFFPDPAALALVGPPTLKLAAAVRAEATALPTYLYPDPSGALAMLMVIGNPGPTARAHEMAYDVVAPILDDLSVTYNQPLPIAQSFVVGIPSGTINIWLPKVPPRQTIQTPIVAGCPHPELREAYALYREAISSSSPFHKFLTLWKTYENVCASRGRWRKRTKQADLKPTAEVFPKVWAYQGYEGTTFDRAKQRLNAPFRVALAHGSVDEGRPRTGAASKDVVEVAGEIPLLRYMARVVIQNFRATLDAQA